MTAPTIGPITGIQAYDQSPEPLFGIGRILCIILGPRSLAGFIEYPVGPPILSPIPKTNKATGKASNDPSFISPI